MPAKYFDVYIRQAGARFTEGTTILTSNVLVGWDKIGIAPEKSAVRAEPITTPVGDGTSICDGFNLVVETGEKTVDRWWFDNLRLLYHNQLCDFLFIDHEQEEYVMAVFGMKCQVYLNVVSGESVTIAIGGTGQKAAEVALTTGLVLTNKMSPSCLVEVECWLPMAGEGAPGCTVTLAVSNPSRSYTAESGVNGIARFLVETPDSPTTATATATVSLDGFNFQANQQVTISRHGKYQMRVEGTLDL